MLILLHENMFLSSLLLKLASFVRSDDETMQQPPLHVPSRPFSKSRSQGM